MRTVELSASFDAPPRTVFEALTDPGYLEERYATGSTIEINVQEIDRSQKRLELMVKVLENQKGLAGWESAGWRVRRQESTRRSWVSLRWHREPYRAEWRHRGPEDKLVEVSGTYELREEGSGTLWVSKTSIIAPVPLAGSLLSRAVASDLKRNWSDQVAAVKDRLPG